MKQAAPRLEDTVLLCVFVNPWTYPFNFPSRARRQRLGTTDPYRLHLARSGLRKRGSAQAVLAEVRRQPGPTTPGWRCTKLISGLLITLIRGAVVCLA
jgi:hypothetical protein